MSNNSLVVRGCIESFAEENEISLNSSELFEHFAIWQLNKNKSLTIDDVTDSITDGSNDGGIDAVLCFVNDEYLYSYEDIDDPKVLKNAEVTIQIWQSKAESSFKELALEKLYSSLPTLLDLSQKSDQLLKIFNPKIVEKFSLLNNLIKNTLIKGGTARFDIFYASLAENTKNLSNAFNYKKEQIKDSIKANNSFPVEFHCISSEELLEAYRSKINHRLTLAFLNSPLFDKFNEGLGYVGFVKLTDYQKFLSDENGKIRDEIFENNIRHFQGDVDVNKEIRKSITNEGKENFWWLNNGITIIAENPLQHGNDITIENVQIVNGLQSSFSIFHSEVNDNDKRSVLIKLIISQDKEVIDHIIKSTNSQNPVSAALLRATDPLQRNIETFFLNNNFFYDRRKNYYKNQGKPTSKIFNIQNVAQSIYSILFLEPHTARSTPTSLLKSDATYKKIFNDKTDLNTYLKAAIIRRQANHLWSNLSDLEIKNKLTNFKFHLSSKNDSPEKNPLTTKVVK